MHIPGNINIVSQHLGISARKFVSMQTKNVKQQNKSKYSAIWKGATHKFPEHCEQEIELEWNISNLK